MAAAIGVFGRVCLKQRVINRAVTVCGCGPPHTLQMQNVRKMSTGKKKLPNQAAEKDKWLPRAVVQNKKRQVRVMPNNWDKFLLRQPEDDIWIKTYYPPMKYSATEAISMHRELAVPEMLNNVDGFVSLHIELNMCTSKKTKFISAFSGVEQMPHYFNDNTENKVLAFCRTKEEAKLAMDEGAAFAGGAPLISQLESGEVRSYMFDHVVCTLDFYDDISKARKHIRDKFPNKRSGAVGEDISTVVNSFRYGKSYSVNKPTEQSGVMDVTLGQLSMPTEHICENLKVYIDTINAHRPQARTSKVGGLFITKAYVTCPPSGEKMYLKDEELISQTQPRKALSSKEEDDDSIEEDVEAAATG